MNLDEWEKFTFSTTINRIFRDMGMHLTDFKIWMDITLTDYEKDRNPHYEFHARRDLIKLFSKSGLTKNGFIIVASEVLEKCQKI